MPDARSISAPYQPKLSTLKSVSRTVSISFAAIDHVPQWLAEPVPADIFEQHDRRGLRLSHARDVGCQQDARVGPEWMSRRRWLRLADIEDGGRPMARIESLEQRLVIEVPAAPDVDQRCAPR